METQSINAGLTSFRRELRDCWHRLPNKGFFLMLLAAWLALFHFLGNSTLGYAATRSLLAWMYMTDTSGLGNILESEGAFALLIPFVVLFLFWLKRKELISLQTKLWWPGVLIIAAALGLHFLGYAVQQPRLSIVAFFTGIYGLTGL